MNPTEHYTQLGDDLRISRVITGLWQIADMERDGQTLDLDAAARAMAPYAEAGLTSFDMADHYGSAEEIAGIFTQRYAGEQGAQVFTKWVPTPGPSSRETVREAVDRARTRLQTECIDLLQYHAWNYADASYLDDLFHLQELRDEGLIRHLGLTNFDTAHLHVVLAAGIDIVSNQICYSLLDQRARGAMAELCEARGVKILAFGTLAGGFLTERWLGRAEPLDESLETWSQMKYKRYVDEAGGWERLQALLEVLKDVADRHGVSMANVATRYILDQPAVGGVIIGARLAQSEHIDNNRKLLDLELDEAGRAAVDRALEDLRPIHGDCGDEYRKPPFLTASGDLSHHLDSLPAPYPTVTGEGGRVRAVSGTSWEGLAGYCRAVRHGDRIFVSGTTATHGDRVIGVGDPAAQTQFVIDKIAGALQSLGGRLEDVVRTRIFVADLDDWEPVAVVHGRNFARIQPANTLVEARLVGAGYRVEIEAEAIVTGG